MVSLVYILTILSVFSAVVFAEEVKSGQTDSVDEKWWGWGGNAFGRRFNLGRGIFFNSGPGCMTGNAWLYPFGPISGCAMSSYYPSVWFKAVDGPAVARRSVSIDADHIYHRRDESVACKNGEGQVDHFVLSDCHQAVQALVSKKSSSGHCKTCAVKLVTPKGQLAATGAPAEALKQIASQMLKSCSTGSSSQHARRSPDQTSNSDSATKQQFAMILQKGDGSNCDI